MSLECVFNTLFQFLVSVPTRLCILLVNFPHLPLFFYSCAILDELSHIFGCFQALLFLPYFLLGLKSLVLRHGCRRGHAFRIGFRASGAASLDATTAASLADNKSSFYIFLFSGIMS